MPFTSLFNAIKPAQYDFPWRVETIASPGSIAGTGVAGSPITTSWQRQESQAAFDTFNGVTWPVTPASTLVRSAVLYAAPGNTGNLYLRVGTDATNQVPPIVPGGSYALNGAAGTLFDLNQVLLSGDVGAQAWSVHYQL